MPVPDDVTADILGRLPPRTLAAARCVCKTWRDLVDGRAMLLPHLLPHSVHGVVINYTDYGLPHLFSRPKSSSSSSAAAETSGGIDGNLSFMPNICDGRWDWWQVMDHCDGLLLCAVDRGTQICVCNPATRRWEMLPPRVGEPSLTGFDGGAYLVFDPAVSPHYEVLLIPNSPEKPPPPPLPAALRPRLPRQEEIAGPFCLDNLFSSLEDGGEVELRVDDEEFHGDVESQMDDEEFQFQQLLVEFPHIPVMPPLSMDDDDPYGWKMEWPPSPFRLEVFSSRTGQWEVREFVREAGEKVTTVEDMLPWQYACAEPHQGYGVFFQGALYVHCGGSFVTRYSLPNGKYQLIETPINIADHELEKPYLGKSEKGVLFGIIRRCQLSVWTLRESAGQMVEWVLNYQRDLRPFAELARSLDYMTTGPWTIEEDNTDMHEHREFLSDKDFEWDSDNDDFLAIEAGDLYYDYAYFDILGFHPYKDVVFLAQSFYTVAYHLNSSKIQYLGYSSCPEYYHRERDMFESFLYTPCMIGELHGDYTGQSSS